MNYSPGLHSYLNLNHPLSSNNHNIECNNTAILWVLAIGTWTTFGNTSHSAYNTHIRPRNTQFPHIYLFVKHCSYVEEKKAFDIFNRGHEVEQNYHKGATGDERRGK